MTTTRTLALLTAILVVGSAFGQAPAGSQAPMLGPPIPMTGGPGQGGMVFQQPVTAESSPVADTGDWWANLDYIVATVRGELPPPLATTSPPGTARASAGVLGQRGTVILFGSTPTNNQARSGVRGDAGYWFDPEKQLGIEGGFLLLGGAQTQFSTSSDGTQILARPFIDAPTGLQTSVPIGFPGSSSSSIAISDDSHAIYTGTLDLRANVYTKSWLRVDSLIGYRYLQFEDRLTINSTVNPTAGPFVPGTTVRSTDSFHARNTFHGLDVGVRAQMMYEDFTLDLLAKAAGGHLSRQGDINGTQVVNVPGAAPVTNMGGLLALPTNIGPNHNNTWTIVPEVGATVGYQVTSYLRLRVGYSLLVVPRVIRSVDQIDLGINTTQIPPATAAAGTNARPALTTQASDIWVNALTVGAEFRY